MDEQTHPYFDDAAIRFLRGLQRHNDREWFNERKPVYEAKIKAPVLALISALNDRMLEFAPDHVRPAAKILLRIYRDTRFSSDKRPYKTHVSAWWGRSGMYRTSGAGFYFDLNATSITVAAGLFMPERDQLLDMRRFLLEHGNELRAHLGSRALTRLGMIPVAGEPLSRTPKGFLPAHPSDDLVRCRKWGVSCTLPSEIASTQDLMRQVVRRFRVAASLVHMLNEPFGRRTGRPMISPLPF